MAKAKTKVNSRKQASATPQAVPAHSVWGSPEREALAHARYSEFCNDLAAAFLTVGDLEAALGRARRALKTIEIATSPAVAEESFVWALLPGDSGKHLKKADKWLRPLAQQLEISAMIPRELSFAIHDAIAEIQTCDDSWKETDLDRV